MQVKTVQQQASDAASSAFSDLDKQLGLQKTQEPPANQEDQKEEEEEEIEEVKDKKDRPQFTLEDKKEKPKRTTKEESIQALRSQRDDLSQKLKSYEETLGTDLESLSPLLNFIKEKANGPITQDSINAILEEYNNSSSKLSELEKALAEKEGKIRDYDIRESEEFKTKYQRPYEDAFQGLLYEFANINPTDSSTIGPKSTESLMSALTDKDASNLQAKDVAVLIRKFVSDYKQETGEEPSAVPSVTALLKSQREFISKRNEIQKAYTNWSQEKMEAQRKLAAQEEQQTQLLQSKAKRERVQLITKAYREFDRDEIDFVDEKQLSSFFDEEFDFTENAISGGKDAPTHDTLYQRGVKARLFDFILPKYKELVDLHGDIKQDQNSEVKGGGTSRDQKKKTSEVMSELNKMIGLNS